MHLWLQDDANSSDSEEEITTASGGAAAAAAAADGGAHGATRITNKAVTNEHCFCPPALISLEHTKVIGNYRGAHSLTSSLSKSLFNVLYPHAAGAKYVGLEVVPEGTSIWIGPGNVIDTHEDGHLYAAYAQRDDWGTRSQLLKVTLHPDDDIVTQPYT